MPERSNFFNKQSKSPLKTEQNKQTTKPNQTNIYQVNGRSNT